VDGMGRECSTNEREGEKRMLSSGRKSRREDSLVDIGADALESFCLEQGAVVGCCEHGNESSGSINGRNGLSIAVTP